MIIGIEALHVNMNKITGIERYLTLVLEALNCLETIEIEKIIIFCSYEINFSRFNNLNIDIVVTDDKNLVKKVNLYPLNILHCTFIPPDECPKCPVIYTLHDVGRYLYPEYMDKELMREHIKRFDVLLANSKCTILTVSEASKNKILDVLKISKHIVFYTHPYINKPFLQFANENAFDSERLKELQLFYSYILVVGCFTPTKNVISIIQCFEKAQSNGELKGLKLVIVGKKGWDIEVEHKTETCDNIVRLFNVSDEQLVALYRNCEFFVSASFIEGFGIPVIEAAYLNAPILCSDIKPYREILEDKPLYFSTDKIDELYYGMINISRKKQDYTSVISKFNSKNMSKQLLDAYKNTINYCY